MSMARIDEKIQELINSQLCYVATASMEGEPNVAPKKSIRVFDETTLFFAEWGGHQTFSNLEKNLRVAACVVSPDQKEAYKIVGIATVERSGPRFEEEPKYRETSGKKVPLATVIITVEGIYNLSHSQPGEKIT
jgi:predicted pyridoxine 5'-phosphate oxidase superfamily flavin-nucleotide-binding protein